MSATRGNEALGMFRGVGLLTTTWGGGGEDLQRKKKNRGRVGAGAEGVVPEREFQDSSVAKINC
jgi:hypothetical protein